MGFRTNPDRILENIDRAKNREDGQDRGSIRQAIGRALNTELPDVDATNPERMKRIFAIVDESYRKAAQGSEVGRLASRFQSVGDIHHHHAYGDVSITIQYLDSPRFDDVGMAPIEVKPAEVAEAKKETRTSRPDVNALKILRKELRDGVLAAYKKVEPRVREALRERADMGHIAVQVTMDIRPAETASDAEAAEGSETAAGSDA